MTIFVFNIYLHVRPFGVFAVLISRAHKQRLLHQHFMMTLVRDRRMEKSMNNEFLIRKGEERRQRCFLQADG